MNGRAATIAALVCLSATACSPALRQTDGMCHELASFANASVDASPHVVTLINDWGGPLSEQENSLFVKGCGHDEYEPAKALCAYLFEHTSTEFPEHNLRRVLRCLGDDRREEPKSRSPDGPRIYSSRSALYVRPGILVRITYPSSPETLEIFVQNLRVRASARPSN